MRKKRRIWELRKGKWKKRIRMGNRKKNEEEKKKNEEQNRYQAAHHHLGRAKE